MNLLRILTLALAMGWTITPGTAPRYSPGVMDRVAFLRGLVPAECQVSSPTMGISSWVYVYGVRSGVLRYCRVTDVSQTIDRLRHIRTGRAVELGYDEAVVICGIEHINDPPEQCPVWVISEY